MLVAQSKAAGKRWSGKTVVITGASAGVGRATARQFARLGASVAMLARGPDGLSAASKEVAQLGGKPLAVVTDVANPAQVEDAAARIEQELGPIDVWINNAMTTIFAPVWDISPEEYRRATEVTYLGAVYGTMAALKRMRPRNTGTIVQVGTALSYRAIPLQSPYCGAKHAIRGFTDSIRCELLHERSAIHVTMVQLPGLNTPQFSWCASRLPKHPQPVPPIFQPEVAARAIEWAAGHKRREVHVGRSAIAVIWLNKFMPGWGDRYLAKTGFDSQQTDDRVSPDRPQNLFFPVPGDHGAHGIFDEQASPHSGQRWVTTHRAWIAGAAAAVVAISFLCAFLESPKRLKSHHRSHRSDRFRKHSAFARGGHSLSRSSIQPQSKTTR